MAEKTEFLQAIDDAILDADSLEQFVNGSETETVLTRLSAEYPTLQNAISQINGKLDSADAQIKQSITTLFENGGLPATPFKTMALMEASELADGEYAIVTDDAVNNGLYVKTAGVWVKSDYDPLTQAKDYVDDAIVPLSLNINDLQKYFATDNLFSGNYISAVFGHTGGIYQLVNNFAHYKGKTAIVRVEPNTTYTVKVHDVGLSTHFRLGLYDNYPPILPSYNGYTDKENAQLVFEATSGEREFTLTTGEDNNFLVVYVSNNGKEPRLKVEKGATATEYTPPYLVRADMIDPSSLRDIVSDTVLELDSVVNLFDGRYLDKVLGSKTIDGNPRYMIIDNFSSFRGKTALVKVEPSTTYTVKVFDPDLSNQMRIVEWAFEPKILPAYADDPEAIGSVVVNSSSLKQYTLTTKEDTQYLGVYVSNDGSEPRLQIQVGEEATRYIGGFSISDEKKDEIVQEVISKVNSEQGGRHNFFVDLNSLYTKESELDDYYQNYNGLTVAEYHARFETLVNAHPNSLERTLLGSTEFDYPLYQYETKITTANKRYTESAAPIHERNEPLYRPKIFVTAGIHGREKSSSYAVYYFLKELMENPQNDPKLDFIKRNVKLVFIPLICASGFEDGTYENRNGQNLNRDFKPYGNETQAETRLVARQLDEHSDMDYHLDFHTSPSTTALGYTLTDSYHLGFMSVSLYNELGRVWQRKHPEMPQDEYFEWGYSSWANVGTVGKYTQEVHGVDSAVFEIKWDNRWLARGDYNNEIVARLGVEVLANMIIGCVKNLIV